MKRRLFVYALCLGFAASQTARAGDEPPLANPKPQVEARGPLHEAFAQPYAKDPAPSQPVKAKPPAPVPEEPPDQRPEGKNIQWIPGYWHFDDERKDFLWVSGFWRDVPAGRRWVVGYWAETDEGYRWVHGHWAAEQEPDEQIVPPPPKDLDEGPSTPAPDDDSFYIPGSWFYTESGYRWRPGYWADVQADAVWMPASYRWSPRGYLFSSGYWDYAPFRRGLLFAPVYWGPQPYFPLGYAYRPSFFLGIDAAFGSLWVRPGFGSYFFGDFYGPAYLGLGYRPWWGGGFGGWGWGPGWGIGWGPGWGFGPGFGFGIGFGGGFGRGFGRGYFYDPLFCYQRWAFRNNPNWVAGLQSTYQARVTGKEPPPPRTLAAQNPQPAPGKTGARRGQDIVAPISSAPKAGVKLEPVAAAQRQAIAQNAQRMTARSAELSRSSAKIGAERGAAPSGPNRGGSAAAPQAPLVQGGGSSRNGPGQAVAPARPGMSVSTAPPSSVGRPGLGVSSAPSSVARPSAGSSFQPQAGIPSRAQISPSIGRSSGGMPSGMPSRGSFGGGAPGGFGGAAAPRGIGGGGAPGGFGGGAMPRGGGAAPGGFGGGGGRPGGGGKR